MESRQLVVTMGLFVACCQLAGADEEFAIKTQVFSGQGTKPVAENLSVFHDGKIYDFTDSAPRGVSVFHTGTRRFVVALRDRRIQTLLSADDLIRFAATEQARAQGSTNPFIRFAADPTFAESYSPNSGRLSLVSDHWEYHVDTQRLENEDILRQYSEFANWYTYLNTLFRPLPAAIRLELNRVLDQHQCFPNQVAVQVKRDGQVVLEQQSRHTLIFPLDADSLQQVKQWEDEQADFETVEFATYRAAQK